MEMDSKSKVKQEVKIKQEVKVKQEINDDDLEMSGKINASLVRIKREPNVTPDCNNASTTNNSFETKVTVIKEEFNSDTDDNVTVHLLIPETILHEDTEDGIQTNSKKHQLSNHNLVIPDMLSMQSTTHKTQDRISSNESSDLLPQNFFTQSLLLESTGRHDKRKYNTGLLTLKRATPQSSATGLGEIVVEPSELIEEHREIEGVVNKRMRNNKPNEVSETDISDVGSSMPQTSIVCNKIRKLSQVQKKRGKSKNTEMMVCPFCDRTMAKSYFPQHARVHTDEKPFKCSKCSYTSHFKGTLDYHMESHHPTEGYIKPIQ